MPYCVLWKGLLEARVLLECEQALKTFFLAGLFWLWNKGEDSLKSLKRAPKCFWRKSSESLHFELQIDHGQLFDLNLGCGFCGLGNPIAGTKEHVCGLGLDTAALSWGNTAHESWLGFFDFTDLVPGLALLFPCPYWAFLQAPWRGYDSFLASLLISEDVAEQGSPFATLRKLVKTVHSSVGMTS